MADFIYPTRRGSTYVVTSQSPCTVTAVDLQGTSQTLLTTEGGGQASFLAISAEVIVTSDTQPSIAPALGSAPVAESSGGGGGGLTPEDVIAIIDEQMPWRAAIAGGVDGIDSILLSRNSTGVVSKQLETNTIVSLLSYDGIRQTVGGDGVSQVRTLVKDVSGFAEELPEWIAGVTGRGTAISRLVLDTDGEGIVGNQDSGKILSYDGFMVTIAGDGVTALQTLAPSVSGFNG